MLFERFVRKSKQGEHRVIINNIVDTGCEIIKKSEKFIIFI